ncbi:hypothetical protein CK203_083667 [Vitis vinifera]|uniref:Uncharacterized protein n=1 Tax=Vitis vinifera TaxID=29760 RepID=A0A438CYF3_VITVI|nr:hypothetical protein CK203_083667 [Vitis vinifera]
MLTGEGTMWTKLGLMYETLEHMNACALEMPFMEDEVFDALLGCNGDKASGLIWLLYGFLAVCLGFREAGAEVLGDFRPISLYKWLAKVLANRLKKVVVKVVSKAQGAFVEGIDAVLIANEAIDSALKNNENDILCKLDIEKAWINIHCKFLYIGQWNPYGLLPSSRGLRQGGPLSPYLFVIAMEVFSALLKRAMEGGFILGLYGEGWLLMWFEVVSRLRINLEKSELIPVGRVDNIDDLAWDFGCRVGSLPSSYLGMPLGASFKSVTVWDGVERAFPKRLSMWKRQYLSKGGRAILIRSTLSNLPVYLMSLLCLPSSIRWRLEKIQRDFLWGGGNLERKPHLSRLELVCLKALWNQVIRGKYGEDRGDGCSREVREARGMGLWKGIRMDWELVGNRMVFIVGNGQKVRFWRDRWCRDSPLCVSFPSLFALTVDKEVWVTDIWDPLIEGGWNPCFSRAFNDWEVKSLYFALEAGCSSLFPSSCIWNVNVQPKISFFAWEATWGKALTLDMIQKRGQALANRCFMCL